jgi:predicted ferric reductase
MTTRPRPIGVATLVLLIVIPIAVWAVMAPIAPRFSDLTRALESVAVASGLAGTAAFALNLFLGGRLWFVETLFGGLDRMYRVHQRNGRVAYLFLFCHVVLMLASYATISITSALHLFVPTGDWAVFLGVLAFVGMTVAISLTLFTVLEHELFVYVQRSFGVIFLIATLHFFRVPAASTASRFLTLYLAALSLAGVGAWIYRSVFGDLLVRRHDYVVTDVRPLHGRVTEITMTPVDEPLRFLPGQFLYVTFRSAAIKRELHPVTISPNVQSATLSVRPGDIANQFHPFSITSAPGGHELKVAVKAVGDYTTAMRQLAPGDAARVEGAYGSFSYRKIHNRRQIWIAGGIGVTPFLSMARSLNPSSTYEIDLYYCTKTLDAADFLGDFESIASAYRHLRVIPFVEDTHGLLTAQRVGATSGRLEEKDILICGPPAMIDNLAIQFSELGVPRRQIHFEKFGFIPKSS